MKKRKYYLITGKLNGRLGSPLVNVNNGEYPHIRLYEAPEIARQVIKRANNPPVHFQVRDVIVYIGKEVHDE